MVSVRYVQVNIFSKIVQLVEKGLSLVEFAGSPMDGQRQTDTHKHTHTHFNEQNNHKDRFIQINQKYEKWF